MFPDPGEDLQASISQEGRLTIPSSSGSGTVRVTAEYTGADCCPGVACQDAATIDIRVTGAGCASCAGGRCTPGASPGPTITNSIAWEVRLGTTAAGKPAGRLFLSAKQMTPDLATPAQLFYDGASDEVEVIRTPAGQLRQLLAPQGLADIVTINDSAYAIRFYSGTNAGVKNGDGLYESTGDPFLTWTIENPDASPTVYNRLRFTKTVGTQSTVYDTEWDAANQTWTLDSGNDLKSETKQTIYLSATQRRQEIRTITDPTVGIVSKIRTTYQTFPWGDEVVEEVVDPDDAALTTLTTYYETVGQPGYGRVHTITQPDGSQVEYVYNLNNTVSEQREYWKDAANAKVTTYAYTSVDAQDDGRVKPQAARTVTDTINSIVVARTYRAYYDDTEIVEQAADATTAYGDPRNQRTTTTYYADSDPDVRANKVQQVTSADGRSTSYAYEQGTLTIGTLTDPDQYVFTPGTGTARRTIVTQGPATAGQTTREISLSDQHGYLVLSETQVYTGSDYARIGWTIYVNDDFGRTTHTSHSDGTETEAIWGCCGKTYERDAQGVEYDVFYDDLNRLQQRIKKGTHGQPDITTTYGYDAAHRRRSETMSGGSLSLSSRSDYDVAGRLMVQAGPDNLPTTTAYTNGGLLTTVTRPGGATEMTERYTDGRVKRISGTGVIGRFYEYGVNSDGTQWTTVFTGPQEQNSPLWTRTTTNLLGQTIREERPGSGAGVILTTTMHYNDYGQLVRTENPDSTDTLYAYDSLGNLTASGLDVDGDGALTSGVDRFSGTNTGNAYADDAWWQVTTTTQSGESTSTKTRLTGLGGNGPDGIVTAETITIDIHDQATISRTFVNRPTKTITRRTDAPQATNDAVSVSVNGLLVSSTNTSNLTTTYGYDGLGRRTSVTDPRTGTSTTHYNNKGQVDWTRDAANHTTTSTYDPATGRRRSVTDTLNQTVHYAYTLRGELEAVWGAAEPVFYTYDDYGRQHTLTTYRNLAPNTEPTADTPGDTTTFVYDEATGLLREKVYPDGKKTTYTYTPDGKRLTRTWARGVTTTYTSDPQTGDLLFIDYSDATPDVSYGDYDDRGRPHTVIDGQGTRTLSYAPGGGLSNDSLTGATHTYTNGRLTGLSASGYAVTYGYDAATGRFQSVTFQPGTADEQTFSYGYVPNSDLLGSLTSNNGLTVIRTYEPQRNILQQVKNQFGTNIISQYDYENDDIGRRDTLTTSGPAFDAVLAPVVTIGETTYGTNELNQYPQITAPSGVIGLTYDDDGNLANGGTFQYAYDAENRMIAATPLYPVTGSKKLEAGYDYQGRRVSKKVYVYTAGSWVLDTTKTFVYDGWNVVKETTTMGSSTSTEYYVWGRDLSGSLQGAGGIGGLLLWKKANGTFLYLYDANGNVGQLVNAATGAIAARYEYDPFGNTLVADGPEAANNPYRFSTKYFDAETGLYDYGYRYYSPKLGRWWTRDPIEEAGGVNLYGFVGNDPINLIDSLGFAPLQLTAALIIEMEVTIEHFNQTSLSTAFIMCLIWQESTFDPLANVPNGGRGLMGLVRSGAFEQVRQSYGIQYVWDDMFDPVKNIEVGLLYLKWLEAWRGSAEAAIKFYRGGPRATQEGYYNKLRKCERCLHDILPLECNALARNTLYEGCFTSYLHR